MLRDWAAAVGVLVGFAASVIGVSEAWGFYPIGLLVLLAILLLAAITLLARGSRRTEKREHDRSLVEQVGLLVSRDSIRWLSRWDFGGSWQGEYVEPYYDLLRLDDVEHRPFNRRLSRRWRRLLDATHDFTQALGQHSFPERGRGDDWRNVGWGGSEADGLEGEAREIWERRRGILNAAADRTASAYDAFMEAARRIGRLSTPEQPGR